MEYFGIFQLLDLRYFLPFPISYYSANLQNAIESENYALAAQLRDEISKLETESLAASAKVKAYESSEYSLRLGQKVRHRIFGIIVTCFSH